MSDETQTERERQQWIRLWLDHMDTCHQLLLAGLSNSIGPNGDLREAYRNWYKQKMHAHDAMIARMAERFNEANSHAS